MLSSEKEAEDECTNVALTDGRMPAHIFETESAKGSVVAVLLYAPPNVARVTIACKRRPLSLHERRSITQR